MVNSQELAPLRAIHLPDPIGWWPLAPGWYLLAFCLMMGLVALLMWLHRCYSNGQAKREALRLLSAYQQQYRPHINTQLTSARLSELLKRVALAYYPRTKVAGLRGDEWIAFLDETSINMDFSLVRIALLELPYHATKEHDLNVLFSMARTWIKQRGKPCFN